MSWTTIPSRESSSNTRHTLHAIKKSWEFSSSAVRLRKGFALLLFFRPFQTARASFLVRYRSFKWRWKRVPWRAKVALAKQAKRLTIIKLWYQTLIAASIASNEPNIRNAAGPASSSKLMTSGSHWVGSQGRGSPRGTSYLGLGYSGWYMYPKDRPRIGTDITSTHPKVKEYITKKHI